jgi:hypothetical protein
MAASVIPGAPQLLSAGLTGGLGAVGSLPLLGLSSFLGLNSVLAQQAWGIYNQDGSLAIEADSTVSFDYSNDDTVAVYPIENGDFRAYNKVQGPFTVKLTLALNGAFNLRNLEVSNLRSSIQSGNVAGAYSSLTGLAARSAFINALDTLEHSLTLVNVVTPEKTYMNANVVHHAISRTSERGVTLLQADVWLNEIRVTASNAYSNTAAPNGAERVNNGAVQPGQVPQGPDGKPK